MAQLSRPYQIVLGVVLVFGLIWAVALRGHASNPSEPPSTSATTSTAASSASVTQAQAEAKGAAPPTPIYHGAAPGVEGLTRAIAKAHGAVATSEENAQQLEDKSREVAGEAQASTTTPASAAAAKGAAGAAIAQNSIAAAALARKAATRAHRGSGSSSKSHAAHSAQQLAVESELAHGKTVMLLFWNPKSTVDQEVMTQARALAGRSKDAVTLHMALANQVNMFGEITEVVHVYQTPTILIVNRRGLVSTLTGLTDVFALEQAVREARSVGH